MPTSNKLARSMERLERLPAFAGRLARTRALGYLVRFVGTSRLDILELTTTRAVVEVANRKRVQNHVGSVHAAAIALLAETATGFVVGMNVPDDRVPVIKSMTVEYKKRAKGRMRAEATLTPEQVEQIHATEKGDTVVAVRVTDETGIEPVVCTMTWAWTPKRR